MDRSWSWSGVGVDVAGVLLSAGGWGGDECCGWERRVGLDGAAEVEGVVPVRVVS